MEIEMEGTKRRSDSLGPDLRTSGRRRGRENGVEDDIRKTCS